VGEPGIGKSRLIANFCQSRKGTDHTIILLQCSPHHSGSPWYPVIRFLEHAINARLEPSPSKKFENLERLIEAHAPEEKEHIIPLLAGLLSMPIGQDLINQFLNAFMKDPRGAVKIVSAPGIAFTDRPEKFVSIINLASVRDIERVTRAPVDPQRFRANLIVDGLPAWSEFDLIDREITVGPVRLKIMMRITRCAATNVNPATGERDLNIPKALITGFGHADCGVFAEVLDGGRVAEGDAVVVGA